MLFQILIEHCVKMPEQWPHTEAPNQQKHKTKIIYKNERENIDFGTIFMNHKIPPESAKERS